MEQITGQVIYRLSHRKAVEAGLIVPVEAFYVDLPRVPVEGCSWREVYDELVVHREDRNQMIARVVDSFVEAGVSTICLVKEIEQGVAICDALATDDWAFAQGVNPDNADILRRFNAQELRGLVGTTGVIGEGVDTKPAACVVIAGLGRSPVQFRQMVGRGSRKFPGKKVCWVIIFRDPSHKWTLKHFCAQRKILRGEYGAEPSKLELLEEGT
jgi:superfamily II DNA or RNA helicase